MTNQKLSIAGLLSNEEWRKAEFPVAQKKVFLAHAAVCPLPKRVGDAIAYFADRFTVDDQEVVFTGEDIAKTRALAAGLLGVTVDEIALVGPTSLGLSFVAGGLKYKRHSNVLIYQDDYPSNVYPWMTLADRGVQVRFLNVTEYGRIRVRDVAGQIDENTRLVALSSAHFVSGFRIDLEAIGAFLRSKNILFCVDGIQTLGAFPMSAQHADFVAADAHKWMLGPCGAGILYIRKEAQELLRPIVHGWHNVRSPNFVAQDDMVYRADARKYEAGTKDLLSVAGLRAALELLLEVGKENISRELLRKRAILRQTLLEKGWNVLGGESAIENQSGILSFHRPDRDIPQLHQKLAERGIVTSLRADRLGQRYIRVSPHFYNSDSELSTFLENL